MIINESRIAVDGLRIEREADGSPIVGGASFSLRAGEVLGVVGESGSGKSTMGLGLLGFTKPGARISAGAVLIDGVDVMSLSAEALREARGARMAYVPQDPGMSLNPALTIGRQLHEVLPRGESVARIRDVLAEVGLPGDDLFLGRKPGQLSGGQQQRVGIAMAVIPRPDLIVLDEPTTGLDVTTQAMVLEMVTALTREYRMTAVYISHDLGVISQVADSVAVLLDGQIVEYGPASAVLRNPEDEYTRMLMRSVPSLHGDAAVRAVAPKNTVLLSVKGLEAGYGRTKILHDVSFDLHEGECVAVVGESGSGKSTLSRSIIGLHRRDSGTVELDGVALASAVTRRDTRQRRAMQYVFQNPYASLQPRRTVGESIALPLRTLGIARGEEARRMVREAAERVRLDPALLEKYPAELSGGQRQRVAIARGLVCNPRVLVCDEVTSALDVSVQAAVLDLLRELLADGLSIIFVTHNMAVVNQISHRVLVVKNGVVVEEGSTDAVLRHPVDEYTRLLMSHTFDIDDHASAR
ncbi:peptide/nickel transport system ATP-binding protein [Microbacterium foliorum]|uniref:Peptide/nickel transport system ATP-binding protein n=1 Tax=Microbacterium foliorum TaxID=104336 RepID=A0ABU1HWM7_9MICO|nr:ABC transporter ATP-binding protein [Microbacterium foliorum]MDR6144068.1 peptide/nickel transport system ATP-binding protein [Microbacterium foliorum]